MIKKVLPLLLFLAVMYHHAESQSWSQLSPSGTAPAVRDSHTAVYDTVNNRMTIFGGAGNLGPLNDVWVLSTANGLGISAWTQLIANGNSPSAPTTRYGHTAVYDQINNRMIIFGGYNGSGGFLNDVWVLSTANGMGGTPAWTQLSPTGTAPAGRQYPTAIYDAVNNLMTIFGGSPDSFDGLNDVWVLSHANGLGGTPAWTQLFSTGTPPSARYSSTAVYDTTNNRMTIFGGAGVGGYLNDVWVLSTANGVGGTPAWTQLSPTGSAPTTRAGQTAVYDVVNNRMTIFAGAFETTFQNDGWILSNANGLGGTPSWTQQTFSVSTPGGRESHTAVYDSANNRMMILGGFNGSTDLNDVWVLSYANGLPVELSSFEAVQEGDIKKSH